MKINDLVVNLFMSIMDKSDDEKVEFLVSFFDKLSDGIIVTDEDGIILFYNKALEELEFRSRENMLGRHLWEAYGY